MKASLSVELSGLCNRQCGHDFKWKKCDSDEGELNTSLETSSSSRERDNQCFMRMTSSRQILCRNFTHDNAARSKL